jgi:hypothetical protein
MKVNKKVFFVLVIMIILANVYQSYTSYSERKVIAAQKREIEKKSKELQIADRTISLALDSLRSRKEQLAAMGEDTTELGTKIREIESERGRYIKESDFNRTRYNQILEEIKVISVGVDKITRSKEAESQSLKNDIRKLKKELEVEKALNLIAKDSMKTLLLQNSKLTGTINTVTAISASPIKVMVIGSNGKSKERSHIKESCKGIRFEFFLLENRHVIPGFKSVFICIHPPQSANERTIITHQKVWFTGEKIKVSYDYMNKGIFAHGEYAVDSKIDNVKITQGTFNIN